MKTTSIVLAIGLLVSGCARNEMNLRESAAARGTCRDAPARSLIGQPATAELGAQVLRLTGARIFEWIAPEMIVTTAFSWYRVRVTYDENRIVRDIRCG